MSPGHSKFFLHKSLYKITLQMAVYSNDKAVEWKEQAN